MSRFEPGALISGKYRIVRLIGDGGMGVVFEARHEVLGSGVALKFLHAELAKRPGLTQRFLQEARVSATIQSPHVTHVTDVDTAQDGSPYLVMELLAGQSLQSMLDRQGKLVQDQAIDFAMQILAGLEAAHAIGVVHRDMKPDNVIVTPSGGGPLLKLIDFGIAKLRASSEYTKGLTRAGVIMGTPEYMAPEQLSSAHTADHRADIYSLGVMLFEMLSGCRPADGEDVDHIVALVEAGRVRKLPDVLPGVPAALVHIVERATAPNREARFDSAAQMRLTLAPLAGQLSHAGRLAAIAEPLQPISTPPLSAYAPPTAVAAAGVPKTVPPDAPPLSMSQLGAARTSLSEGAPPLSQLPRAQAGGTALGAPLGYAPAAATAGAHTGPAYSPLQPVQAPARRRRRSGLIAFTLVVAVLGGGGAVGYAAYRAAERGRVVLPPLPDITLPTAEESVEPLSPLDPGIAAGSGGTAGLSAPPVRTPGGTRPPISGPVDAGASSPGPVVLDGGHAPGFQLPFPLPSSIALPTALPSGIQFPPGFPTGFPAQPPATTPPVSTPATPPVTTTAPPISPSPTPAPTSTRKRPSTGTKP